MFVMLLVIKLYVSFGGMYTHTHTHTHDPSVTVNDCTFEYARTSDCTQRKYSYITIDLTTLR